VDDITASFNAFKREIALTSENSRTGKPIPQKVLLVCVCVCVRAEQRHAVSCVRS
jgi:hypothetical protein